MLTGTPTKVDCYRIEMALRDANGQWQAVPLDTLSATVMVMPGPLSNAHTGLSDVPTTLVAGVPVLLYIQPTDRFGNIGAQGGTLAVQLYDGKEAIQCAVTQGLGRGAPLVAKVPIFYGLLFLLPFWLR